MSKQKKKEITPEERRKNLSKNLINLAVKLAKRSPIAIGEFYQRDLIGKTIEEYVKVGNPRPVFTSRQSPNPAFFEVQLFSDGTFLLADSFGDGGCKHTTFYYHDGKNVYYSGNLFG